MIDRRTRSPLPRSSSWIAVVAALSGCGGAHQPEPQKPATPAAAVAVTPSAPDLSPAPEPTHVVGIVRWRSPAASLAQVSSWTGFPIKPAALLRELDEEAAQRIDAEAPVDGVVALDPKADDLDAAPFAAFSFGLRSFEDGKHLAESYGRLTEISPGIFRFGKKGSTGRKHKDASCVLAAAPGRAPARIVCGETDRDVEALAPYMIRTLPLRDFGPADVHLELRFAPAQSVYGPLLARLLRMAAAMSSEKLGHISPTFDRALGRAAIALADEVGAVAADLDTLKLDFTLAPERVTMSSELHLRDRQSWFAGTLRSAEKNAAAAPEDFWRLPASSTFAMFGGSTDPKRYTDMVRTIGELADGWLEHEGIAAADRAAVTGVLSPENVTDATWVSGSGPLLPAPPPKAGAGLQAKNPFSNGWRLWSASESEKTPELVKRVVLALNRPKMKALFQSKLGMKDLFAMKLVPAPPALPKGSLDVELTFSGVPPRTDEQAVGSAAKKHRAEKTKAPEKPKAPLLTAHLLVMVDAGHTWLAFGADRNALTDLLTKVKQGGPSAGTLAGRDGLELLRTGRFTSGGFFSLEMLADGWLDKLVSDDKTAGTGSVIRELLRGVPHQGQTPMPFTARLAAGTDDTTWTGELRIPKAAIEDMAVLAAGAASGMLKPRRVP